MIPTNQSIPLLDSKRLLERVHAQTFGLESCISSIDITMSDDSKRVTGECEGKMEVIRDRRNEEWHHKELPASL